MKRINIYILVPCHLHSINSYKLGSGKIRSPLKDSLEVRYLEPVLNFCVLILLN